MALVPSTITMPPPELSGAEHAQRDILRYSLLQHIVYRRTRALVHRQPQGIVDDERFIGELPPVGSGHG
jgi:hypothetical protein